MPREDGLVKMSELAKRAGVPSATIKHYMREGLVPGPELRTSRNMAYYDARSVERVRAIKQLQVERALPLHAIGALLAPPLSEGADAELAAASADELLDRLAAVQRELGTSPGRPEIARPAAELGERLIRALRARILSRT